jgi:uncharacterized membrane protein YdfJ with MMPL/SSD domain
VETPEEQMEPSCSAGPETRDPVALLLAVASPVFRMHLGTSGVTALPDRFESKRGFAALERDFPGATSDPAEIVASLGEFLARALTDRESARESAAALTAGAGRDR